MPTEVTDLILTQLAEIKAEANQMHDQILRRIDDVDDDVQKWRERITTLEVHERHMRWVFAAAGGVTMLLARELVGWFVKDFMPAATDSAAMVFIQLIG